MTYPVPELAPALPEIWLAVAAMVLLLFGVVRGDGSTRIVAWAAVVALVIAGILVVTGPADGSQTFSGMFVADRFGVFVKVLVLSGSAAAILMSLRYLRDETVEHFEYPVLIVLATVGMMMMVAASDLISLYLGLELQSLSLYILAAFKRDSVASTESGLKYFLLGALASGIFLYGASLIYGFTGATGFAAIAAEIDGTANLGMLFGMAFLIAGLAFKVSAVPFHMWTPDVYQGAPTPVTAFFAVAPKITALAVFMRVMLEPFGALVDDWSQILVVLAALSMGLGAFAAIGQTNLKRLLAYSSIGHVGFALMGLAAGTAEGARGILIYVAVYLVMNIGAWAVVLTMRRDDEGLVEGIDDLAGMGRTSPVLALAMAIFLFSLAGIPPMAGFFAKFYVFLAAIEAGLYWLAVIGALATVVGAFYYLRVIKIMYFDEPARPFERAPRELSWIIAVTAGLTLFFFLFPGGMVAEADLAAQALWK